MQERRKRCNEMGLGIRRMRWRKPGTLLIPRLERWLKRKAEAIMPQGDKVPGCHDTASAENEDAMDDGTAAIEREQEDNTVSEQGV